MYVFMKYVGVTPPGTRLLAPDEKQTNRPSALIVGDVLRPLPSLPSNATDSRRVPGTHPDGASMHVSRRNTSNVPLVSPATKRDSELVNTA